MQDRTACPTEFLTFATELAELAGDLHRRHFRASYAIETKNDGTIVTAVDKAVEETVREAIMRRYPAHGIRGEEFPSHQEDAEFVWIIDPLDGTREFVHGFPLFCFLLGLSWRGKFVLGLAHQAVAGDLWLGADSHGTRWNGTPVHTRVCPTLASATVSTPGYDSFCHDRGNTLLPIRRSVKDVVTADSSYVLGLLAMGRMDAVVSAGFALHDYAAFEPIVRNAGGLICDWSGADLGLHGDGTVLAVGDPALRLPIGELLKA